MELGPAGHRVGPAFRPEPRCNDHTQIHNDPHLAVGLLTAFGSHLPNLIVGDPHRLVLCETRPTTDLINHRLDVSAELRLMLSIRIFLLLWDG